MLRDKAGQIFGDSGVDFWAVRSKPVLHCEHILLWLSLRRGINGAHKKPFTNTEPAGDVFTYDLQQGE